ncbi:MAG: hypothetical protein AB7V50_00670 [Vampirovibrionia bacterium]
MHLNTLSLKGNNNNNSSPSNKYNNNYSNQSIATNDISFTGNPIIKGFSVIESNPVLALALLDLCGMIAPRTFIDINRNKEELGHLNWDAGRETLMREIFSSGVMFFGPGVVFNYLGNKLLENKFNPLGVNTKAFTDYKTLSAIEKVTADILKTKTGNISIVELRQEVAKALLNNIQSADKGIKLASSEGLVQTLLEEIKNSSSRANIDKIINKAATLNPNLDAASVRKGLIIGKNKGVAEFMKSYMPKLVEHLQETEATLNISGTKPVKASINNIIRDIFGATDDVISKAANGAEQIHVDELKSGISNVLKETRRLKVAKVLIPFAVVFAMLTSFPKFSAWLSKKLNGGKDVFPGLAGLSKESEDKVSFTNNTATSMRAQSYSNNSPFKVFDSFERRAK